MSNNKDFQLPNSEPNTPELFFANSLIDELLKNDSTHQTSLTTLPQIEIHSTIDLIKDHPRPSIPKDEKPPKKKRKPVRVNLEKLLFPLKKEQLEEVILQFIKDNPDFENNIRTLLPTFDVAGAIQEAQKLKQKVFQAFPNTRYGSSYDHYSFNHVKSFQSAYITAVRKPITAMSSAKQWDELLDYLLAIIEESAELPDWDCEQDRKQKINLFKIFSSNLMKVLKQKEQELSNVDLEQIVTLCTAHNTVAHGTPFSDCLNFVNRK